MLGHTRPGGVYYRCHPAGNNRGRPDKREGHPPTVCMREDLIMVEVSRFFAERVFGPNRRELFLAALDTAGDAAGRDREEQRQRLRCKLADITRKQHNVLTEPGKVVTEAELAREQGHKVGVLLPPSGGDGPPNAHAVVAVPASMADYARELYAVLRELDRRGCDVIVASLPPEQGLGLAIANRLRRAAGPRRPD